MISVYQCVGLTNFSAQDPGVTVSGRTTADADGLSRSFDWEGVSFFMNVNNTGAVWMNVNSTSSGLNRVIAHIGLKGNWYEQTRQWVQPGANMLLVASNLNKENLVRVFFELEPAFNGGANGGFFTVNGFSLDDGGSLTAPFQFARRLEIVGDSISAGYGAMGIGGGCPVMDWTSSNYATYDHDICEFFQANCSVVAWSGKGMYENCCDSGETMPSYYLQAFGGRPYSTDWDFSSFVPDAMLINLGTNDFDHDSGPAWEANFTSTYVAFVLNATHRYGQPTMPVFLAQGNMNNGLQLQNALLAAATAINNTGGSAFYLDLRVGPTDGCGGHPGTLGHAAMFAAAKPVIGSVMGWT